MSSAILAKTERYFTAKLARHGPTAQGADWKDEASQQLRFEQLARLLPLDRPFHLSDLGCGYGAFFEYCRSRYPGMTYVGYDVSAAMIGAARSRTADDRAEFIVGSALAHPTDYVVASGIFNAHLGTPEAQWEESIFCTLDHMNEMSRKGLAFNCFSTYVDYRVPTLYYADPLRFFDHCKRRYSRHVALLHDYPLYEFTILVRKEAVAS